MLLSALPLLDFHSSVVPQNAWVLILLSYHGISETR
uniref:Uncharacterized protein n=1 Tax=Arundo donax TaxID=35708 RepID=A0A0A9B200_ARUDO